MKHIALDISKATPFLAPHTIDSYRERLSACALALEQGTCAGNDFLGWLHLPSRLTTAELEEIESTAGVLRSECDTVVVAGIGGSYLGARAVIEALANAFPTDEEKNASPELLYAGNNISEDYLWELCTYLKQRRFGIINISKSGTTTETALSFRLLKKQCEEQRGKDVARRVTVAITDACKGAARQVAEQEGHKTFVIPDDVGGRFSVLTAVGLLPIACAGYDIRQLAEGARQMEECCRQASYTDNIAMQYAAIRHALYTAGKRVELIANYHPKLHYIAEWWKQLYGESEGKDGKGLFPAACDFTTDLHSMGQYIQEGERLMMETVLSIEHAKHELHVPEDEQDLDGLNYLASRRIDEVNKMAELGTQMAHVDGGVPNLRILIPELTELYIGQLIYFFEYACALSGIILGVNPFNQPGVEAYKRNMFRLLGKPGYEK